jgi:hypothetical protein
MFIRPCYRKKNGKRHAYWALVESHRTDRGPRQRVVAYLGQLKEAERRGVKNAAQGKGKSPYQQLRLFDHDDGPEPEWVEIDTANVRVENQLDFGGPWLALKLIRKLKLDELLEKVMPPGKEDIPWSRMALVLVISRLCDPSSELHIAEHYYGKTAMPELLGIPSDKVKEVIDRRVGKIMALNSRAAGLFEVEVKQVDGRAVVAWTKNEAWRDWATLNEGCYLLRTNVTDWSAEDLWQAYIQLTEAEAAFRIHKSDLRLRPIWHQKEDRVKAHILVCFLAYVLWKTLHQLTKAGGLGDEPRRIFEELGKISLVDVVLPTRSGIDIRRRCVRRPTDHQAILLGRLGLALPRQIES